MKDLLVSFLICAAGLSVCSADIGLVYENEAAVREGRAIVGAATSEGILVSAKFALANNATLLMGIPKGKLCKAHLLRLDAKLDVAILHSGEEVKDLELQEAFAERVATLAIFLPVSSASVSAPLTARAGKPYVLRINGNDVGSEPIELPVKKSKSGFDLEVVRMSTVTVWFVEVEVTADPKLSFWKKNKERKNLNDIPHAKFNYSYQGMFAPLTQGKSFKIPVEVHFIKEESYTLNIKVSSKSGSIEKIVPIHFKPQ